MLWPLNALDLLNLEHVEHPCETQWAASKRLDPGTNMRLTISALSVSSYLDMFTIVKEHDA